MKFKCSFLPLLDVDMRELPENGVAIENISWKSPPVGEYLIHVKNYNANQRKCYNYGDFNYQVLVRIGHKTRIYHQTAIEGDKSLIEIAKFRWDEK